MHHSAATGQVGNRPVTSPVLFCGTLESPLGQLPELAVPAGVDGVETAGAGETGADGLLSAVPPPELPASPELAAAEPSDEAPAATGFADEYRSLYQPDPLNCTAAAVKVRFNEPPQCGQVVKGASENFWIFSTRRWHCWHWYS